MEGIPQREFVFRRIEENTRRCSGIIYDLHKYDWEVSETDLRSSCKEIMSEIRTKIIRAKSLEGYEGFSFDFYGGETKGEKSLEMRSGFGFSTQVLFNSLEWALHNLCKRHSASKEALEIRILVAGYV